jgi:hypothetical protein
MSFTAAVTTNSSVVVGDFCDVSVAADHIVGYREGPDGGEIPEMAMSDQVVMDPVETTVRTLAPDPLSLLEVEAAEILHQHGWRVTGPWQLSDNAGYAPVERF